MSSIEAWHSFYDARAFLPIKQDPRGVVNGDRMLSACECELQPHSPGMWLIRTLHRITSRPPYFCPTLTPARFNQQLQPQDNLPTTKASFAPDTSNHLYAWRRHLVYTTTTNPRPALAHLPRWYASLDPESKAHPTPRSVSLAARGRWVFFCIEANGVDGRLILLLKSKSPSSRKHSLSS